MACPREEREKLEHLMIGPYGVLAEKTRESTFVVQQLGTRTLSPLSSSMV